MRSKAITWCFLSVLFCFLLIHGAWAETGEIFLFRIRPQIDSADLEREDGSLLIGAGPRRKQKAARIHIGPEGRTEDGEIWDLAQLLTEHTGSVLHAFWRVEVKHPATKTSRFRLIQDRGGRRDMERNATEGWNLWDVTDWMEDVLRPGEDFTFVLKGAKSSTSAELDIRRSWVYVSLRFEEAPSGLKMPRITDSLLLDTALSALQDGHWTLKQYQEIAGSLTRAQWPETGVPYYFGGHSEEKVLYHRFFPLQESRYYKPDRLYLCGFDCGSFLHWVEEKSEYLPHDSLSDILRHRASLFPLAGLPLQEWNQALLPGDILVFDHGTLHTGMYLGTPRMFGLTAEAAPELAEWLDAPMMIHCGEDPFCYDRFKAYIESQDFRMTTSPPDGGVTVSLLVPSSQDAPHVRTAPWGTEYGYFSVLDQTMTVFPLDSCVEMAWFRPLAQF